MTQFSNEITKNSQAYMSAEVNNPLMLDTLHCKPTIADISHLKMHPLVHIV